MSKEELKTTIKKTNRLMIVSVIVLFLLLFLTALLGILTSKVK
jgi:hypothetical protein